MKNTEHDTECDALWVGDKLVKERCTKECKTRQRKKMRGGK